MNTTLEHLNFCFVYNKFAENFENSIVDLFYHSKGVMTKTARYRPMKSHIGNFSNVSEKSQLLKPRLKEFKNAVHNFKNVAQILIIFST
jgi:hypothetical protein